MPLIRIDLWQPLLMIVLQQEGANVPAYDVGVVEGKRWVDNIPSDHAIRCRKIVLIMAIGASKCEYGGHGIPAAAGTTSTLLIIGASGRHVAKRNAGKCAKIDADLHRRRARKNINSRQPVIEQSDVLEQQF